ncbi:LysR substrate-binding domain-containing protein [Rhizobium leguminosarum]|uniref:LysR substrate-binding domain-containing protein n=1 Tax=Rhizobium leguminosarum TaxID=384 RepID=UPI00247B14BD|nr:LysR substrate-binding domain-containing protein [Rhizobium leguminosarum]
MPESAEALRQHRVLDKLHGNDLLGWSHILGAATGEACETVSFRSDDFEALNGAAIAGMGVAFLPSWVSGPSVRAGDLVRLKVRGEEWNEGSSGIYLLRALQVPSAKVRAFTDALKTYIGTPPRWSSEAR